MRYKVGTSKHESLDGTTPVLLLAQNIQRASLMVQVKRGQQKGVWIYERPVPAAPGGDPSASDVRGAGLWLDGAQNSHVAGGSYAPQCAQAGEVWAVCESGDTSVVFVGETLKDG
jgi:hypothetical protein